MTNKYYLHAISKYSAKLAKVVNEKASLQIDAVYEKDMLKKLSDGLNKAYAIKNELETALAKKDDIKKASDESIYLKENVLTKMEALRDAIDSLEEITSEEAWPFPSYGKLLFGVR